VNAELGPSGMNKVVHANEESDLSLFKIILHIEDCFALILIQGH
jgi:hypothetical protein